MPDAGGGGSWKRELVAPSPVGDEGLTSPEPATRHSPPGPVQPLRADRYFRTLPVTVPDLASAVHWIARLFAQVHASAG